MSTYCTTTEYEALPDMKIQINEHIYTLPLASYIWREDGNCYLLIMAKDFGVTQSYLYDQDTGETTLVSSPGYWILGNNFMHNYYSIYDLENELIGLVPSAESAVGKIEYIQRPWTTTQLLNILLVTFLALVIAYVSLWAIDKYNGR